MNLILFANNFPYVGGEQFLKNEFEFTQSYFEKIIVFPLYSNHQTKKENLPNNTTVVQPLFENHKNKVELLRKGLLNFSPIKFHIKDFFEAKVFLSLKKIQKFFISLLITRATLSSKNYKYILEFIKTSNNDVVLYFYWGDNFSWIIPYLSQQLKRKNYKIIVRYHRTDLYEYLNDNYSPVRRFVMNAADKLIPISNDGLNYLKEKYPQFSHKMSLSRLGVFDNGLAPYVSSNYFTIVSVSYITTVKRVDLLLRSLKKCKQSITWYHFGNGELMSELKNQITDVPSNLKIALKGNVPNAELIEFYKKHQVDIFMNVSTSEGLPVSIMEAISFGIPVIATNVGGTSEIVSEETGILLPVDIKENNLALIVDEFLLSLEHTHKQLRRNCRYKFEKEFSAELNYTKFYNELKWAK